jgi:4a-hydroxytetrahydrobiopterin dehydratase
MVAKALRGRVTTKLPGWHLDGEQLVGRWRFADFGAALAAAVRVGSLAERVDHHPDMQIGWGKLEVRLTTHSAKALTSRDVELGLQIHKALGRPPRLAPK